MFKIVNKNQILINRGDIGTIELTIPLDDGSDYVFAVGDTITFDVYPVDSYQVNPLIHKEVNIEDEGITQIEISLTSDDTRIGPIINKPVRYWYEIQLNHEQTILGYDTNGPKIFMLYPEGVDA